MVPPGLGIHILTSFLREIRFGQSPCIGIQTGLPARVTSWALRSRPLSLAPLMTPRGARTRPLRATHWTRAVPNKHHAGLIYPQSGLCEGHATFGCVLVMARGCAMMECHSHVPLTTHASGMHMFGCSYTNRPVDRTCLPIGMLELCLLGAESTTRPNLTCPHEA